MYVFPEGNRASFLSQPTTLPVAVGPMQNAWRRGRFVWMPVGQAPAGLWGAGGSAAMSASSSARLRPA